MAKKEKAPVVATHGVFYTDGGCKPSRGIGGYGIHGYTYVDEPAKQGTGCKSALPTGEGYKVGESGIPPITLINYIDALGSLIPESTNNIAELTALVKTLGLIKEHNLQHALILMDSEYVRVNYCDGNVAKWEANGWVLSTGAPVKNVELWQQVLEGTRGLEAAGVTLKFKWVKGHSGDTGNEAADTWASKGILAGKNDIALNEVIISPAQGYWNTKTEINRMFSQPNWFFHTHEESYRPELGKYVYYLGEPREDDELLGKKMVDAAFCVLHMNEPEPVLEVVRKTQKETDVLLYGCPVIGHLSDIFAKEVYEDLSRFQDRLIRRDYHNGALYVSGTESPVGRLLSRELRPARLAFSAMDSVAALETTLFNHLKNGVGTKQRSTDITALLYETSLVGKKEVTRLKSTITSAERVLTVTVQYLQDDGTLAETTLPLTLGHDLPDRNTLAALADQAPTVFVAVWPESPYAVRYGTIVETTSGRGVWCAIYSNLHLVLPPPPVTSP